MFMKDTFFATYVEGDHNISSNFHILYSVVILPVWSFTLSTWFVDVCIYI